MTFVCTALLLLFTHVSHFGRYKRVRMFQVLMIETYFDICRDQWSDQMEIARSEYRTGGLSPSFSWWHHRLHFGSDRKSLCVFAGVSSRKAPYNPASFT